MTGPIPVPRPPRAGGPTGTPTGSTDPSSVTDASSTAAGPRFDELLSRLDGLDQRPVGEHHDRLAEVHESLHAALHQPPSG